MLQAEILKRLRPERRRRHGRRRRCAGDLFVSCRDGRQHPRLSRAVRAGERPPASVITLEENYRSTQGVLDAANALIAEGTRQYRKVLRTTRAPGIRRATSRSPTTRRRRSTSSRAVLETRESGVPLKRQAVLFRSSHHSDALELELTRRNIPYREVRRPEVSRSGARQGSARGAALGRQPEEPHRRVPRAAAAAGNGAVDGRAVRRAVRAVRLFVERVRDFARPRRSPTRGLRSPS